jgi:hypothetical protein
MPFFVSRLSSFFKHTFTAWLLNLLFVNEYIVLMANTGKILESDGGDQQAS